MSLAELTEQPVELLPARTVLSLWRAGIADGILGDPGDTGTPGANGQSTSGGIWMLFTGHNQADSGPSAGHASSKTG